MRTEQELREFMEPLMRDELMRSWREGVQVGLKMAHSMAEAVRNEVARRVDPAHNDCERAEFEAQITVLRGLMEAFLTAADDVVKQ